jgi:hypothetical protein
MFIIFLSTHHYFKQVDVSAHVYQIHLSDYQLSRKNLHHIVS